MSLKLTSTFCILGCLALASVRADDVRELTDDEQAAIASITQENVLGCVGFLASDEMKGRDTPSVELTIATAYVAAQFKAAGLEGLEEDGSLYQTHTLKQTRPPATPELDSAAGPVKVHGILCGSATEITGAGVPVGEDDVTDDTDVVCIKEYKVAPQIVGRPGVVLAMLRRHVQKFDKEGRVILISCPADSPLRKVAAALAEKPVADQIPRPKSAIVLVEDAMSLVGQEVEGSIGAQETVEQPVRNVIGVLRGSDETLKDEAIIVSAHLDHIGTLSFGPDRINNGADDNATGSTAVVRLASAFSRLPQRPKRSVIFATFWGEEKGLLGSKAFVEGPSWPLEKIVANVNIEMIGRPEKDAQNKAWMTGWKHSNLGQLLNEGAQRVGVEVFNREDVGEMLYSRSDNYPFVKAGVVAHSVSAGSLHDDYHQPSDEIDKLDIPHMTNIIKGLFAGVQHLADDDVTIEKR